MTDLRDPTTATVFIVGRNQRNGYDAEMVGYQEHVDALFNRNGQSCRQLYDRVTAGKPSRTRANTDRLRNLLFQKGIDRVLETNVICYSSPMSSDLANEEHKDGKARGTDIFRMAGSTLIRNTQVVKRLRRPDLSHFTAKWSCPWPQAA